jgi:hypothetical protein
MSACLAIRTALVLPLIACSVGEVPTNGAGPDGGGGANACVARVAPAATAHTHIAGGGTNAGMNCIAGGCHLAGNTGTDAPPYQYAGTVYVAGSRNPSAGATVQIKAGGMVYPALTDDAGNFNFAAGTVPGMFTATVVVSGCPAVMTMPDALVSGGDPTDKNCNGCHGPGGGQQPITL